MKDFWKSKEFYFALGAFFFLSFFFYLYLFTPNYFTNASLREFEIKKGETLNSVVERMFEEGLIRNTSGMKIAAYLMGAQNKIRAGKYILRSGSNFFEILEQLQKGGKRKQKRVVIPEGIWQNKLAGLLRREMQLDSAKIMKLSSDKKFIRSLGLDVDNLEGYLLPDTYYFFADATEKDVLERLKYENDKIFKPARIQRQMKKLRMNRHQILTLASIIDGESNKVSEFNLISAVYHNRLRKGIPLQADPTIQYLKRNRKRYNKIYYKDLEINSPFNTYKYPGLPPAPINNPGKDAIYAALFPAKADYLYFVADGKGGHKFAVKYSDHLKNIRAYRKWRSANR